MNTVVQINDLNLDELNKIKKAIDKNISIIAEMVKHANHLADIISNAEVGSDTQSELRKLQDETLKSLENLVDTTDKLFVAYVRLFG